MPVPYHFLLKHEHTRFMCVYLMFFLSVFYFCDFFPVTFFSVHHVTVYLREMKTPANPRHSRDSSEVKARHFSPAVSPLSPAQGGPRIQMFGA